MDVKFGLFSIDKTAGTLLQAGKDEMYRTREVLLNLRMNALELSKKEFTKLPERLMSCIVTEENDALHEGEILPKETFLYNIALVQLALAASNHRTQVDNKGTLTSKDKIFITANYLIALSSLGIYLADSIGVM